MGGALRNVLSAAITSLGYANDARLKVLGLALRSSLLPESRGCDVGSLISGVGRWGTRWCCGRLGLGGA